MEALCVKMLPNGMGSCVGLGGDGVEGRDAEGKITPRLLGKN